MSFIALKSSVNPLLRNSIYKYPSLIRTMSSKPAIPSDKLDIEIISPGDGKTFPQPGDLLTVHYTGTLTNGKKFDSSVDRNKPFQFRIGQGMVIQGWDQGFAKLSLGEKARLTVPPLMAYGNRGFPGLIPPMSTLIFDVELLKIN